MSRSAWVGVEDPGEISLALGLDSKKGWPPELLDVPGKFYLRARSQGLNSPGPARGYLASTAQVHHSPPTTPAPSPAWTQSPPRRPPATRPPTPARAATRYPGPRAGAAMPTRGRSARAAGHLLRWATATQKSPGC